MLCKIQGVVALLLIIFEISVSVFPESPRNTTCVRGQSFTLNCRIPGNAVVGKWEYNGSTLYINNPPDGVIPTSENDLYSLILTCVSERHYVTVQCIAVLSSGTESGPPALIKVQDLPDRVQSINYTSNHSSIALNWEGLDPTPSNTTYCVTVYNTTDEDSGMGGVLCEDCTLRDPYFVFSDDQASPIHRYQFVVTAETVWGKGPPSLPVSANFTLYIPGITSPPPTSPPPTSPPPITPSPTVSEELTDSATTAVPPSSTVIPTSPSLSTERLLTWIIVAAALLAFLCVVVIATLTALCCCLIIKRYRKCIPNEMDMVQCGAYESTIPKCKDSTTWKETATRDFGIYESVEHIYADIPC